MIAIKVKPVGYRQDGNRVVEAYILSNDTPVALPTTGADITGMDENDVFAPGSVIYVLAAVSTKAYIANESGVFIGQEQQSGGSGTGGGGSTVSLDDVVALIANFSDTTSYTILNGAYYGTKRAIVS